MKLAVLICGVQNSGKSSTIKYLINKHSVKELSIIRRGWQRIFLNTDFNHLNIDLFCVPASPTETNIKLSSRFEGWIPDILFVAEQINGHLFNDTINFLNENNFTVQQYFIEDKKGDGIWERFEQDDEKLKLEQRAVEIVKNIRNFIQENNLL